MINSAGWFYWALLSAIFAALTAIFAKVGIQGVDSDLATLIRTAIIIVVLSAFVAYTGKWANPLEGIVTVTIEAGKVDRCRHPSPFTTAIVFQTPSSVARCAGISDFS